MHQAVIDGRDGEAVTARGLVVSGDLDCTEMISRGPVRVGNARVDGSVQLAAAQISSHADPALDAANAVIGAGFDGSRMIVEGETRLRHARIAGRLLLTGAQLRNSVGVALGADGLAVEGGMWCSRLSAAGEVRLAGARLGASLMLTSAELCHPAGVALNLDRAALVDLDAAGLVVCGGSVSLVAAQVATRVNLAKTRLTGGTGARALAADGCVIGRRLILDQAHISGEVSVGAGQLGTRLLLRQARIENPGGTALCLSAAQVAIGVLCEGMIAVGTVDLGGAKIGRCLDFTGARVINPGGAAIDARALQAGELSLLTAEPIRGIADFSHARIAVLRDDPQNWPEHLRLGGTSYDALEPQLPAQRRLDWLALDTDNSSPQPYEQLAVWYARTGRPADARQVLYAAERLRRATTTLPGRIWSFLQDITVGYGYRPARAALWLFVLLVIGTITYTTVPPAPLNPSGAPHFNPVIYTLDLLLPVIDLGQKHAFNPAGAEQWLSYMLAAGGWVLATTIAASVARILTRR
ncbi:MAG TPA: hypothetical protein VF070_37845 [Streptosporangiaceae bacterium]